MPANVLLFVRKKPEETQHTEQDAIDRALYRAGVRDGFTFAYCLASFLISLIFAIMQRFGW